MKYHLYIDNFRGFSNTCIPIKTVNFFVGQNSTGKTSVLGLLKLFSGAHFLKQQAFGDEEVNFGHFSDMVSAHSENRSSFRIGLLWEEFGGKKNGPTAVGWLSTFVEEDGMPQVSKYTYCRGEQKVWLEFRGNDIHYNAVNYPNSPTVEAMSADLLPQWVSEHSRPIRSSKKLSMPKGFPGRIPVMLALSLIHAASGPGTKKGRKTEEFNLVLPSPSSFPPEVTWIAPIRTKPRRTYDELNLAFSPEGGHTPYLIRRMLRSRSVAAKFHAFIEKVGKASGLFQDVRIKNFGPGATAPFELDIVLDGKALNLSTVGYGVSQSLPVLVEILAREHGTWFAIQQPEVHLHPCAQAALGDVIFEMAAIDHKFFIVETHSDFTIDRFRMNYKDGRPHKPDSQILFFERREKHNVVIPLAIGSSGELPSDQPQAYRDFFVREELRLLGM